jgi:hypothetical protein
MSERQETPNSEARADVLTFGQSVIHFGKVLGVLSSILIASLLCGSWALGPFLDSHVHFVNPHPLPVYSFRLVRPHWLLNPNAWPAAESLVRCGLLGNVPLIVCAYWIRNKLRRSKAA